MSILNFWPSDAVMRAVSRTTRRGLKRGSDVVYGTHFLSRARLHSVYKAMIRRCYSPNANSYRNYGGRGISVCKRWRGKKGFDRFLADMGDPLTPGLSVEREDNSGNYTPGNCRWATRREQGRNKRSNRHVTYEGERRLLIELAEEYGIPYKVLHQRHVQRGWDLDRALNQPLKEPPQLRRDGDERRRLVALARRAGLPYKLVHKRHVQRGWSLERALQEPVR